MTTPGDDDADQEASAAETEAAIGDDEVADGDQEDLAAEWESMVGGEDSGADPSEGDGRESKRVLDQEEIDSLLGFDEEDGGDDSKAGIEAILSSASVSYERLPMLEVVLDRLVRLMSTSLRNFTSDNVEVSLDKSTSIRFED